MIHENRLIVTYEDLLSPVVEFDFPALVDDTITFRVPNKRLILMGIVKAIDPEDDTLYVQYERDCGTMFAWISVYDVIEVSK
jgi:hypothetical protein